MEGGHEFTRRGNRKVHTTGHGISIPVLGSDTGQYIGLADYQAYQLRVQLASWHKAYLYADGTAIAIFNRGGEWYLVIERNEDQDYRTTSIIGTMEVLG